MVRVSLNLFMVTRLPTLPFAQLDVVIKQVSEDTKDRPLSSRRKQDVIDRLVLTNSDKFPHGLAFDGQKNAWALISSESKGSTDVSGHYQVAMSERNGVRRGIFNITLQHTAVIQLDFLNRKLIANTQQSAQDPQVVNAVMLLQQLVLSQAKTVHALHNARSVFPANEGLQDLGGGLEALRGFFQSVRPTINKIPVMINVDTTTSAGYRHGQLMDRALDVLRSRNISVLTGQLDGMIFRKLKAFFKGVKVTVHYKGSNQENPSGARPIKDIVPMAGQQEFELDLPDGSTRTMTVELYYRDKGVILHHPRAFGVRLGRSAIIPAELCMVVPHQLYKSKVPTESAASMVKFAEQDPKTKSESISTAVRQKLQWTQSALMQTSGMVVDVNPLSVDAPVLRRPVLHYGNGTKIEPQQGKWNVVRHRFWRPAPELQRWVVIVYTGMNDARFVDAFIAKLRQNMQALGISAAEPRKELLNPQIKDGLRHMLKAKYTNPKPQLVVAVLPPIAADVKRAFKHVMLTNPEHTCPSQCVKIDKIKNDRGLDQYTNNLALKINEKLGGSNAWVDDPALNAMRQRRTIIFGADVTHPGPGVFGRPSIASLVWTRDPEFTSYNSITRVQAPRTEIIDDLSRMIEEALIDFAKKNSNMPQSIIFYRDGVSEGEYDTVRAEELKAINNTIDKLWTQAKANVPKPLITFIVVGKRHHVRIFPDRPQPKQNCEPGVIVSSEIQSPYALDWYSISQGGLKGTSVPAHYVVLEHQNKQWSIQDLQQASYALCYSYHRATRSVSIPAPVYYADLACTYASFQFDDSHNYADDTNTTTSGDTGFDLVGWGQAFQEIDPQLRKQFYFL